MPGILCIDDEAEKVQEALGAEFVVRYPEEVTIEEILAARLILVDYRLEHWPEREIAPVSRAPKDGLAVIATLAAAARAHKKRAPTAFALYSGDYTALVPGDISTRAHVVARAYNVEWVFEKGAGDTRRQCAELQTAVHALPQAWPPDANGASASLHDLLHLKEVEWKEAAIESIERAFPPIMELSSWTDGVAVLRWLLHRVLPYPTFLLGQIGLALDLRVTPQWLEKAMGSTRLSEWLSEAQYRGVLCEFEGPRWWSPGVSSLRWRLAPDGSLARFHRELASVIGDDVEPLKLKVPVAVVHPGGEVYDLEEAARTVPIHVDDWPSFASPPHMRVTDVAGNAGLEARVHVEHRWRIEK